MRQQTALEAVAAWSAAHMGRVRSDNSVGLRDFLALELERVLPDPDLFGVGLVDDEPWLLLLGTDGLQLASASLDDQGSPSAHLIVPSFVPRPAIHVVSVPSPDFGSRRREWSLTPASGEALTIVTSEIIRAPFSADVRPDSGEILMRTLLARTIGRNAG
jgi:hypothetical protein